MQDKLNIPLGLEETKKRHCFTGSNQKWLFGILAFIIFLGMSRIWLTRDLTSNFHTNGLESTIRIIKTPSTTRQIHENLGSAAIISGSSITFNDILLFSKREFSLHMDESGVVREISIDSLLDEKTTRSLRSSGLFVYESGHKTIISSIETDVLWERTKIHPIRALNPWYDGELIDYSAEKPNTTMISISERGIKISSGQRIDTNFQTSVADNTEILANFNIESNSSVPILAQSLLANISTEQFIRQITQTGFQLIIGRDDLGSSFYITIPAANSNTQEAAQLAQELLKHFNLSTLALTMSDGTVIQEIRSDTENFTSTIETEAGISFLTIIDEHANAIYIAQTSEFWTISNRKTTLSPNNITDNLACNPNAHSYLFPAKIFTELTSNNQIISDSSEIPFILRFQAIAITNSNTKMCW